VRHGPLANSAPALPIEHANALHVVLREAQRLGFLGAGPVEEQVSRSLAFGVVGAPTSAVDLGSGGGVPAFVLAALWEQSNWALIESNQKRAGFLQRAVVELGLAGRCQILCQRAEELGRGTTRSSADLVTARSFGPPAPTAECAAPLLHTGGLLLVAEPPDGTGDRWSSPALSLLGLVFNGVSRVTTPAGPTTVARLESVSECPDLYPRRAGMPFKRPLF